MAGAQTIGATVLVRGLAPLQRALKHTRGELPQHVRKELRAIGEYVRTDARGNIHNRSGDLGGSIRVGVTQRSVSVYSDLVYARVQDQGGRVGRNHATLLKRAEVSQYMRKAVAAAEPIVQEHLEKLLGEIESDFGG